MTTKPVWEPITIAKALSLCDFDALYVAMNLAFACSLRIGEILGLTWNDIHFAEDDDGASWLHVTKTLLEVSRQSVAATEGRDILMVFPSTKPNSSMSLILKKPKTKNSIRKVYLPRTIAGILKEWHTRQLELIDLLGQTIKIIIWCWRKTAENLMTAIRSTSYLRRLSMRIICRMSRFILCAIQASPTNSPSMTAISNWCKGTRDTLLPSSC